MTIEQTITEELERFKRIRAELDEPELVEGLQEWEWKKKYIAGFRIYWYPERLKEMFPYLTPAEDWWNTTHGQRISREKYPEDIETEMKGRSELYLSQTPRQFRDALHQACTNIGLVIATVEQIVGEDEDLKNLLVNKLQDWHDQYAHQSKHRAIRMVRELRNEKDPGRQKEKHLVENILFPLYVEMRRMGYSHKDLRL